MKPTVGQACHCPSCLKSFRKQDWCDNRLTNIDSGGHKLGGIDRETIVVLGAQGPTVGGRGKLEKEASPYYRNPLQKTRVPPHSLLRRVVRALEKMSYKSTLRLSAV